MGNTLIDLLYKDDREFYKKTRRKMILGRFTAIPDNEYCEYPFTNVPTEVTAMCVKLPSDSWVLDVGCGAFGHMMELACKGYNCVGFDSSEKAIRAGYLKKRIILGSLNYDSTDFHELIKRKMARKTTTMKYRKGIVLASKQGILSKKFRKIPDMVFDFDGTSSSNEAYLQNPEDIRRHLKYFRQIKGYLGVMDNTYSDGIFSGFSIIPENSFDGIISINSLHYSSDLLFTLYHIVRSLRTNRSVFIFTWKGHKNVVYSVDKRAFIIRQSDDSFSKIISLNQIAKILGLKKIIADIPPELYLPNSYIWRDKTWKLLQERAKENPKANLEACNMITFLGKKERELNESLDEIRKVVFDESRSVS